MKPQGRLAAVIELLETIANTPRPADAAMRDFFRARRYIGSTDRAEIATRCWQVIRATARLCWWLNEPVRLPVRIHALAYEMLSEAARAGKSYDALAGMCNGGQYAPDAMDEAERKRLPRLDNHTLDHPDQPAQVRLECPDWAWERLSEMEPQAREVLLAAMMNPAALDLRVNALKAGRAEMLAALTRQGLDVSECALSPLGLRVLNRPNLGAVRELQEGFVEVQDEAAQVAALLLGAQAGERVVDFCAGAGGKTLALAAAMKNKGRIVACDVLEGRLKKAALRFRRAGAFNVETRLLASATDPWVKKHKGSFDRVFVDAPCSGMGTWRRNPDSRWRRLGPDLAELTALQAEILASAARLVRPGGRLLYATCSLLHEENAGQVARFLAQHPDFSIVPARDLWSGQLGTPMPEGCGEALTLDPARHGTDGFFTAVMRRAETA